MPALIVDSPLKGPVVAHLFPGRSTVKKASLSRRLLAGMAALAVGLGGAIALSGPAHAVVDEPQGPVVVTEPTCEDDSGYFEIPEWPTLRSYQIDGEDAEPGVHERGPGSYEIREIGQTTQHIYWSETYTFAPAEGCEEADEEEEQERKKLIKEPSVTQPTCEGANGYIHIPAVDRLHLFNYKIDGEPVERGSSNAVTEGHYKVIAIGKVTGKKYQSWHFEIVAAEDCEAEDEEQEEEAEEPNGEGGEQLPKTGFPTMLAVGAALSLLTLGAILYFIARRRITFTA